MNPISGSTFDEKTAVWKMEQQQPWMALRYHLEYTNIKRHVTGQGLHILDAGGGNGASTIRFAGEGHTVSLVDFSAEMLADAKAAAGEAGVSEQMAFHQADITQIPGLFPEAGFDLVICHNVLQYVGDLPAALRAITQPLRPGGWLSVVVPNRYAEVYKAAIGQLEPERARSLLGGELPQATLFGVAMRPYAPDELDGPLSAVGCPPLARYGIRCFCDWMPNELKFEPGFMKRLERLEMEATDQYPYYLLARFIQIIARKRAGAEESRE